jgi:GntR family transcriptional regulator, transcriptional repressor for pyruvate dehydrogenase complex
VSGRNHVAEQLQALLAERDLHAGDRLPPERQLAAELGIARSGLREGMRRLVDLGVLEARRGSGTYLAAFDPTDLLETRLLLEVRGARLAAQHRKPADLAHLDDALAELRGAIGDPAAFAAADRRVHELVAEASGSLTLRVLQAALDDLVRASRMTTVGDAALRAGTLDALERLVAAIRAGSSADAERAMRTHLRDVGRALARTAG